MKTIEEQAQEYADGLCNGCLRFMPDMLCRDSCTIHRQATKDFIAGAKAAQEWISVGDEWPKKNVEVLAVWHNEIVIAYWTGIDWYLQGDDSNRGYPIGVDFWRPIDSK